MPNERSVTDRVVPRQAQRAGAGLGAQVGRQRAPLDAVRSSVRETRQERRAYARVLQAGDAAILFAALALAQIVRFGVDDTAQAHVFVPLSYAVLGVLIGGTWWISLQVVGARSTRVIGHGPEEYRRVVRATVATFAILAMISLLFEMTASRVYLAVAFPLGLIGLLAWRKIARVALHRRRVAGKGLANVLVVGGVDSATKVAEWMAGNATAGFRVTGVWSPRVTTDFPGWLTLRNRSVPVLSNSRTLHDAVLVSGAEVVLVSDTEQLGGAVMRELTWELDAMGVDLMLSPNVLDVAPSRLYMHDVSGMPLLHLEAPRYSGATKFAKAAFDRVGAAVLVVVLSPLLLIAAIAVTIGRDGPVLFRQERAGIDGKPFRMIKFRSMKVGAHDEYVKVMSAAGQTQPLAKLARDPRVTKVGGILRRYSLDELPQLFNVLSGDMSLVGPRPPFGFEVEQYDHVAYRRLRVRPGMTGLWQVSGRSDLSFEEAIRLDVYYVENWSMTSDLIILWKTARAVIGSDGAY